MARHGGDDSHLDGLPSEPVQRIVGPLAAFLHVEAAGGVVLLAATVTALVLANSPWAESFLGFWKIPVGFEFGSVRISHSLKHWISDGLMAVFFFVVGLEVKRELVLGELREVRKAALPIAAALGGMIVPAGLYLAFQLGEPGERGWGIPMATDIAFVVGCLAMLGPRVPAGLRIMLLSLAIADDIGAVLVIALGYTTHLSLGDLGLGLGGIAAVILMARIGVRNIGIYTLFGAFIWFEFHQSGVHATIAGVVLGLLTPAHAWIEAGRLGQIVDQVSIFLGGDGRSPAERRAALRHVERATRESLSPLERIEGPLHPWVSFLIMPIFALANAGVPLGGSDLLDPVATAVVAGLVIGKPVGIVVACWLAIRLGLADLPQGVSWGVLTGAGFLAGIGFTMALFISGLALEGESLEAAKLGVLVGSGLAGIAGVGLLLWLLPPRSE